MIDLSQRSFEKEWMDIEESYSKKDLESCLKDIAKINHWTKSHTQTLKFVENAYKLSKRRPFQIVDIGCGSGDLLILLAELAVTKKYEFQLMGLELNEWSCEIAGKNNSSGFPIRFMQENFFSFNQKADVFINSLLTHHLGNEEWIQLVERMSKLAQVGWHIHDLHRHKLPYYFIKKLSRWIGLHPMVQNDAPLSVKRAFKKNEIEWLLQQSNTKNFRVNIQWEIFFKYNISALQRELLQ